MAYITLTVDLVILGNDALIKMWTIFVAAIIISFTLWIALKVKGKTVAQEKIDRVNEGYITIPKSEYEEMKAELERLKAIVDGKEEKE